MSVRRPRPRPARRTNFAFCADNLALVDKQIAKYPEGRQASAVIPAVEGAGQEGWISEPCIRWIGPAPCPISRVRRDRDLLHDVPWRRSAAPMYRCCGTTPPCMLRGRAIHRRLQEGMGPHAKQVTEDGQFRGKRSSAYLRERAAGADFPDTYEDLTVDSFNALLDAFARRDAEAPPPGRARPFRARRRVPR